MATEVQHSLTQQIADVCARVTELQGAMCGAAPFQRELAPAAWDEITATLETIHAAACEHEQAEAHIHALNTELAQRIVAYSAQLALANQLNVLLRVDITEHQRREAQFLFHVASAVGQGTTVTLYLPCGEEATDRGLGGAA